MDANDVKVKEECEFKEYLEIGDSYYQKKDIDSAIKNYFSALKIDNTNQKVLLNVYMKFSSAKFSNTNDKVMKEICLFFLNQQNICHRYGFDNFLRLIGS